MRKTFNKQHHEDESSKSKNTSGTTLNYVTPTGLAALQDEYRHLMFQERPKIVEVVRWAAGNGDRSENGDYIYGKKRLREIDRRLRYLTKKLESAKVVDPELQKNLTKVFFGAIVTYADEVGENITVQLVGVDEADLGKGKISWTSPVAKALLKAEVGDRVKVDTPEKQATLTIIAIKY